MAERAAPADVDREAGQGLQARRWLAADHGPQEPRGFTKFVDQAVLRFGNDVLGRARSDGQERARREGLLKPARLVERLSPAIDEANHPVNPEYPWTRGGDIVVPASFAFDELWRQLQEPDGVKLLKLVHALVQNDRRGFPT